LYTIAKIAKRFLNYYIFEWTCKFFQIVAKIREKNCLAIKRIWSFQDFLRFLKNKNVSFSYWFIQIGRWVWAYGKQVDSFALKLKNLFKRFYYHASKCFFFFQDFWKSSSLKVKLRHFQIHVWFGTDLNYKMLT
jgi:hypothetical protein